MGWVVLPGLFIRVVGSMLYQLIEPGAKSKNLIDESCFNKQPPEHCQLQSGYMTRNSHEKRMSFYKVIWIIDAPQFWDIKYCDNRVVQYAVMLIAIVLHYLMSWAQELHIVSPLRHCWFYMDSMSTSFCLFLVIFIHFPSYIPCAFNCIDGTLPSVHGRFNRISGDFSP